MASRIILHCDCNSFFASVESALNPSYNGLPMAVCGSTDDRHGIVLAKNELAKSCGIRTADTVFVARRLCPNLTIVKPHYDQYVNFSSRINEVYADYSEMIEPFGIDESWIDITDSAKDFEAGYRIAEDLRARIKRDIGVTVSIGVSFNKVFSKLGSDYKKPDAVTVIDRDNFKDIVYPLPVRDMIFVGHSTAKTLEALGIRTLGDLAAAPAEYLARHLGKHGEVLSRCARGEDESPVVPPQEDAKSVGNGYTFKRNLVSLEEVKSGVDFLAEEIGHRLRLKGCVSSTVSVSLKDDEFKVIQRQCALPEPTDISREISECAMRLIGECWRGTSPLRSITVTAQSLSRPMPKAEQIDMFSGVAKAPSGKERERVKRGEIAVDDIRRRFGGASIVRGSSIGNDIGIRVSHKDGHK